MVGQNTVSRDKLTVRDKEAIEICEKVSRILQEVIPGRDKARQFHAEYGKVHYSRDAGFGRGAGKLQRDALCTRGRQGKAPFSNRNLRWHPLVVSTSCPPGFAKMNLEVDRSKKLLKFVPEDRGSVSLFPDQVYTLDKPHCVPADAWRFHVDVLRKWSRDDWIQNWCAIPIIEFSPRSWAVETFGVLGIAIAVELYNADLDSTYQKVTELLTSEFGKSEDYPGKLSEHYPKKEKEIIQCPLCKSQISQYPADLQKRARPLIWNPPWQKSKRQEGADESIQLMHVEPLVEKQINHHASNVRYGHRWCNVAMTDHSVENTVDFMAALASRH